MILGFSKPTASARKGRLAPRLIALPLSLVACLLLCTGCLVVRNKHLSEPADSGGSIRLTSNGETDGIWDDNYGIWQYHWIYRTKDFDLDVSPLDTRDCHQIFFWFYVLPLPDPTFKPDLHAPPLSFDIQIAPKRTDIVFDPSRLFVSATNDIGMSLHAVPVSISAGFATEDYYRISSNAAPVSSKTSYRVEFNIPNDPDRPFELEINGLSRSGTNVPLPKIAFKPKTIIRPEFVLPY